MATKRKAHRTHAPQKLSDLKSAPYNARDITARALVGLERSMTDFGDMSGIVFNRRTGHLVSGHQRVKALMEQYGDLAITDHTIRTKNGREFGLRIVDWDLQFEKAANIAANAQTIQGEFLPGINDVLKEIAASMPEIHEALMLDDILVADYAFKASDLELVKDLNGTKAAQLTVLIPREEVAAVRAFIDAFGKEELVKKILEVVHDRQRLAGPAV